MNTADAAYALAHDYPGGTEALAPRLGMSGALLRNKVNTNRTGENRNVLTLAEAVRMTALTGDKRIVEAWARELGLALIELPAAENCGDADVVEMMAKSLQTHGEIGREITKTFADGKVERHEARNVRDRVWAHMITVLGLAAHVEGMAEPE